MMEFKKPQCSWHYLLLVILFITNTYTTLATPKKIFIIPIKGKIDFSMQRYLQRGLDAAKETNADHIILELDTYGGTLQAADSISKILLAHPQPIDAFINSKAISAGALLAVACSHIYMTADAKIGAATVVTDKGEVAPEKYQSLMRAMMRTAAEANGWDPSIAENMVSTSFDSESNIKEVITLTTKEAIKNHFCTAQSSTIEDLLLEKGREAHTVINFQCTWVDILIDFLLTPWISVLLIIIIIISSFFLFQEPILSSLAISISLSLYWAPNYLYGFVSHLEILLFCIGLLLCIIEICIIPGFGIIGILGISMVISSLIIILLPNNGFDFSMVSFQEVCQASSLVLGAIILACLLIFIISSYLGKYYKKKHPIHRTHVSTEPAPLKGKKGLTHTILRPTGKACIDGHIYNATTEGDYLEKGTAIVVIEVGSLLIVKKDYFPSN